MTNREPRMRKPRSKAASGLIMMAASPLLAIGPFLVGWPLATIFCPQPANEGNCSWAALPWMCILTIPAGGVLFIVGLVTAIVGAAKESGDPKS